MSKELKILAGRHCRKRMNFRITHVDDGKKGILGWIVYGTCEKCKSVIMSSLYIQEMEPINGVDFVVDYRKDVKATVSSDEFKKRVYGNKNATVE